MKKALVLVGFIMFAISTIVVAAFPKTSYCASWSTGMYVWEYQLNNDEEWVIGRNIVSNKFDPQ